MNEMDEWEKTFSMLDSSHAKKDTQIRILLETLEESLVESKASLEKKDKQIKALEEENKDIKRRLKIACEAYASRVPGGDAMSFLKWKG